jgi:hypothetical protein
LTFCRLRGFVSQKMVCICTTVRASNPTGLCFCCNYQKERWSRRMLETCILVY